MAVAIAACGTVPTVAAALHSRLQLGLEQLFDEAAFTYAWQRIG
jgi:hypothetical protein